jgi:3D-(3,5/4)-trihydroxycyclohexane-1,2-dione acylhydrolase (decyclizing)
MKTKKLTTGQAIIQFLLRQQVERDGERHPFFAGCLGIFGHGCIAGVGQALRQYPEFRYYQTKNEQASVHIAAAFAKMNNRLRTFACISSIGPGATNMVTGAAVATVNRLPVLLMPGDIFARRNVAPVLQQLEQPYSQDISVNDAFKPVSKYWDRINRPDQIICALPEVMRVLTSPADTGAVTLALPQDVQAEAHDYPVELFEDRVWYIPRAVPEPTVFARAVELIRASKKPLIVAGGGVLYSEAHDALARFAAQTGMPVGETQAGKGSLKYDHPQNLGAIGVTGTFGANIMAREADLVLGIGTRYSDFTTASKTAFQNPKVRFINLNVGEFDAFKHSALPMLADARAALEMLAKALRGWEVSPAYRKRGEKFNRDWDAEVARIYNPERDDPPISQGAVIGAVNDASRPQDVVLCAAGSLPGDLHRLWRTRDPKGYHLEYGYSCMGYEVAGGLGVKMADPDREVYVMVGDGSWLMLSSELITSVQEGYKLTVVLLDNHGFQSIGGLSRAIGNDSFGVRYRLRGKSGQLDGANLPVDYAANAASLGAHVIKARDLAELKAALQTAKKQTKTTVIVVETDPEKRAPGYESWWDVPIAIVSEMDSVRRASKEYEAARTKERYFL